ncbi:hypothetical protein GWC77_25305 [Paraburkholderia sp. NMBU_R16]|uniref:hypothetical protein n=1 Tax=Paraburkholderia sp. NMBU_R16 TaxID=2698676 RepID=UPI00156401D4|nr:hypothetical protein [Paraburkholderia sp. NMBU_R16]NRO99216.1 hypothetical protein [Paraburkholderia sp. NMBU_R16]
MSGIDPNNLFDLIAAAAVTADAIASDTRLSANDRAVAASIRDVAKAWRRPAFDRFSDWTPQQQG